MISVSSLDPRDAILQAHTPVVTVPRFGELAPLGKSGHRYLVDAQGLWIEVRRPWLHVRAPLASQLFSGDHEGEHALPFGKLERLMQYGFSGEDLQRVQTLFLYDARKAMPDEYAAWAVYDERTQRLNYVPLIAETSSPDALEGIQRPRLEPHEHLAIDLHSHGALSAFFSSTDDADDRGEVKVAVVVGGLDEEPQWETRLCLLGLFIGPARAEGTPDGTCRICGCTDERACPGGCEWVEPDLCSRCA